MLSSQPKQDLTQQTLDRIEKTKAFFRKLREEGKLTDDMISSQVFRERYKALIGRFRDEDSFFIDPKQILSDEIEGADVGPEIALSDKPSNIDITKVSPDISFGDQSDVNAIESFTGKTADEILANAEKRLKIGGPAPVTRPIDPVRGLNEAEIAQKLDDRPGDRLGDLSDFDPKQFAADVAQQKLVENSPKPTWFKGTDDAWVKSLKRETKLIEGTDFDESGSNYKEGRSVVLDIVEQGTRGLLSFGLDEAAAPKLPPKPDWYNLLATGYAQSLNQSDRAGVAYLQDNPALAGYFLKYRKALEERADYFDEIGADTAAGETTKTIATFASFAIAPATTAILVRSVINQIPGLIRTMPNLVRLMNSTKTSKQLFANAIESLVYDIPEALILAHDENNDFSPGVFLTTLGFNIGAGSLLGTAIQKLRPNQYAGVFDKVDWKKSKADIEKQISDIVDGIVAKEAEIPTVKTKAKVSEAPTAKAEDVPRETKTKTRKTESKRGLLLKNGFLGIDNKTTGKVNKAFEESSSISEFTKKMKNIDIPNKRVKQGIIGFAERTLAKKPKIKPKEAAFKVPEKTAKEKVDFFIETVKRKQASKTKKIADELGTDKKIAEDISNKADAPNLFRNILRDQKGRISDTEFAKLEKEIEPKIKANKEEMTELLNRIDEVSPTFRQNYDVDAMLRDVKKQDFATETGANKLQKYRLNEDATKDPVKAFFSETKKADELIAEKKKFEAIKVEDEEGALAAAKSLIRFRRSNLNLRAFESNKFIHAIERALPRAEREILPFIIEKTDLPAHVRKSRPDLAKLWDDPNTKKKLGKFGKEVEEHFNEGWQYMKDNIRNFSAEQIENYVTHIWDIPNKRVNEATNWFITNNKFLKRRFFQTFEEGIEAGFRPRTLDITEIIRIHDLIQRKSVENKRFADLMSRIEFINTGEKLIMRADKARSDWVYNDHPALKKSLVKPGKITQSQVVSQELQDILFDLGVSIGKRLKPGATLGKFIDAPPTIRLQRFFEVRTLAHETGHYLDLKLGLKKNNFVKRHRDELMALNRERIDSAVDDAKFREYASTDEELIAELYAHIWSDLAKAKQRAPGATREGLELLQDGGNLQKLADFDWSQARVMLQEQINSLIKLGVRVHPALVKPINVILGSIDSSRGTRAYEQINAFMKKAQLSLSFFHHFALIETGVSIMGPIKTARAVWKAAPWKIIFGKAENNTFRAFEEEALTKQAIARALQIGATADIPIKQIQKYLDNVADKAAGKFFVGRAARMVASFNSKWDKALWDSLHDGLKLEAYHHLTSKYDLSKYNSTKEAEEEIAQFVNDTFGGQNWEILMVEPRTLQKMSWFLLSPDWTVSTARQFMAATGYRGKVDMWAGTYRNLSGLRQRLGLTFWAKTFWYYGIGMNMWNAINRGWDMKENPNLYTDEEKKDFLGKTMYGNTIGHKTHLFAGRNADGTENYVRWGKQFREVPELFMDDLVFSPFTASLKKIGGKAAPLPQIFSTLLTGKALSGYEDQDLVAKQDWERAYSFFISIGKKLFPFSSKKLRSENDTFHFYDLAFSSSKGVTKSSITRHFIHAIEQEDEREMTEIYQFGIRNNLEPFKAFTNSLAIVNRNLSKEATDGLDSVEEVNKQLLKTTNKRERRFLKNKRKRLRREQRNKNNNSKLLNRMIKKFKLHQRKGSE